MGVIVSTPTSDTLDYSATESSRCCQPKMAYASIAEKKQQSAAYSAKITYSGHRRKFLDNLFDKIKGTVVLYSDCLISISAAVVCSFYLARQLCENKICAMSLMASGRLTHAHTLTDCWVGQKTRPQTHDHNSVKS